MVNETKNELKSIIKALKKRAKGYKIFEVTEEYALDGNELKLNKKKVSSKDIPPDATAAKLLLGLNDYKNDDDYDNMSEEELNNEKQKLFDLFSKFENQEENDGNN